MADDVDTVADAALEVVADVMGAEGVRPEKPMAELRSDSVTLLRLIEALQERFDITVDVVDVFSAEVVGDLVRLVEESATPDAAPRDGAVRGIGDRAGGDQAR